MQTEWNQCVDAVIGQLEALRDRGVRYLAIAPETLAGLDAPSPRTARPKPALQVQHPALTASLRGQEAPKRPPDASADLDSSVPSAAASHSGTKAAAMLELRERALNCHKCPHLVRSRKNVVFGVGDMNAPLMFVGEAPGADEDEQGEPFVGAAGQLLTRIIRAMGFTRDTVYIANILKCRPDTPGQTFGNRPPTAEEMKTCSPYLLAQIDLIQPKVIVALGATAVKGLLGLTEGITKLRGHFQNFRGISAMPTYHPSYLLRNEALSVKRLVWEDMLQVLEKLDAPITEKQRNYFLKAG